MRFHLQFRKKITLLFHATIFVLVLTVGYTPLGNAQQIDQNPIRQFGFRINNTAISGNGTMLALCGTNVQIYNLINGQQVRRLYGHRSIVMTIAYSPDGTRLVTSSPNLNLWNPETGDLVTSRSLYCHSLAYSTDGTRIVATFSYGSSSEAYLLDATTLATLGIFYGSGSMYRAIAISPDNSIVAIAKDSVAANDPGVIELRNAATGSVIRTLSGHSALIHSITFSPDGSRLLSASQDDTARLWNTATGALVRVHSGHLDDVKSACFSPDSSEVATISSDGTVKVWNTNSGQILGTLPVGSNVFGRVYYSGSTQIVTVTTQNSYSDLDQTVLRVWNRATQTTVTQFLLPGASCGSEIHFSPDGSKVLSGGSYWQTSTGKRLRRYDRMRLPSALSPDGSRVAISNFEATLLYNASTGVLLRSYPALSGLAFSPDGSKLATGPTDLIGTDDLSKIWNVETAQQLTTLSSTIGNGVRSTDFSWDGNRVVLAGPKGVKIYDSRTGALIRTLVKWYGNTADFSYDGKRVVVANESWWGTTNTLSIYDAATGATIRAFPYHPGGVSCASFSPAATRIVSGSSNSDGIVKLWDAETGDLLREFHGHSGGISAVGFSPDGKSILSVSVYGEALLWDIGDLPPEKNEVADWLAYP